MLAQTVDAPKNRANFVEQRVAGGGQIHPARTAREQRRAEIFFEARDLVAERRLRDVQGFRGAAHVPACRNFDERTQVTNLHDRLILS